MIVERHLLLQKKVLTPSAEWQPSSQGWLALRIAEGEGYWLQNGAAVRSLSPGDVLVIGRLGEGILRASQLGALTLHYFTVLPRLLSGVLTMGEGHQLEPSPRPSTRQFLAFSANDAISEKFAALAAQMGDGQLTSRCACLQLWSEGIASFLAEKPAPPAGNNENLRVRFRQLVGQIPETELATHSLAGLAGQLHCSERHFSRLFREEFGISLRARQIELRLQRARQLLAGSNAKIINVAYESGYHHLGLFNAMFKKRFSVTPSEWRRQSLQMTMVPRLRSQSETRSRMAARMALAWLVFLPGLGLAWRFGTAGGSPWA